MKKTKYKKKRRKKRKIIKRKKSKSFIIKNRLTKYISIAILIILYILIQFYKEKYLENDTEKIIYKGFKIQKEKLIKDYLSRFSNNEEAINKENQTLYQFFYFPEYSKEQMNKGNYKNQFFEFFSKIKKKPINKIETIFVSHICNFGNCIIMLNNIIFYCEVIGCHKIILDKNKNNLKGLIKNQIYITQLNITIFLGSNIDCNNDNILCQRYRQWNILYPTFIKPQIRTQYIKEEIIINLPPVNIDPDDLYIHIRGGDAFSSNPSPLYPQPPLCFYEKIIKNNKFKKIHILSMDKRNPVLNALINKYNDIVFKQNDLMHDISLLVHAFNIVASISSFLISSIKFNDHLKNLWEYDIYRLSFKYIILHHHLYKFDIKYKIYTMKSSEIYADKMFVWTGSKSQLKLMLEDTCPYDFISTNPNIK